MQRHGETKTAESRSLITECACGYNKAKKRTACTSSTLLFYAALSAMGKEQKKKKHLEAPTMITAKVAARLYWKAKAITTLSARCACVCADINQEKKGKSVADMLARRALTRSRLVRQVSSVLPLTAGKMGMAP